MVESAVVLLQFCPDGFGKRGPVYCFTLVGTFVRDHALLVCVIVPMKMEAGIGAMPATTRPSPPFPTIAEEGASRLNFCPVFQFRLSPTDE